ncbi:metallophosphoesterase [Desulforegula conservatrix]|uniref:metallophosphoesterase n=1 Tax=Desulforegula conservatrix TaxID=153026 RepID=UPI0003FEA771|nr:metallophosphoesterase [Desulforegula conservatrix]
MIRLFIFLGILLTLVAIAESYIYRRVVAYSCVGKWGRHTTRVLLFALLAAVPLIIGLQRLGYENFWTDSAAWIVYMSLGFLSMLLMLIVIMDIFKFTWWGTRKFTDAIPEETEDEDFNPGRRVFIGTSFSSALIMASAGLTAAGTYQAVKIPEVRMVTVPAGRIPEALTKLKIVQISDIHAGPTLKRSWIEGLVRKINKIEPDILVLTGDLVDGSVQRLGVDVSPLAEIKAKLGKYYVTGNHEYYSGVLPWLDKVKELGFEIFQNNHKIIEHEGARLLLAGVPDFRAGGFIKDHASDPMLAIKGAPDSDYKILLAHQPKSLHAATLAGFDLQISGHTHGGQFWPWNLFVGLDQPVTAGLKKIENMHIYVSRGTGYWGPPVRLGAPSEITLIRLAQT